MVVKKIEFIKKINEKLKILDTNVRVFLHHEQ